MAIEVCAMVIRLLAHRIMDIGHKKGLYTQFVARDKCPMDMMSYSICPWPYGLEVVNRRECIHNSL